MLRINEDYILRDILGEFVIVPVKCQENNADFYALNESGALIMRLIADGADKEQIVGAICEQYEADAAEAAADVDEFIGLFAEKGVLCAD